MTSLGGLGSASMQELLYARSQRDNELGWGMPRGGRALEWGNIGFDTDTGKTTGGTFAYNKAAETQQKEGGYPASQTEALKAAAQIQEGKPPAAVVAAMTPAAQQDLAALTTVDPKIGAKLAAAGVQLPPPPIPFTPPPAAEVKSSFDTNTALLGLGLAALLLAGVWLASGHGGGAPSA